MTEHFPITPTPELVKQWQEAWYRSKVKPAEYEVYIVNRAAQWGADQELEACCKELEHDFMLDSSSLRAARRPKPPSLKEQALLQLDTLNADLGLEGKGVDLSQIRRALEALPDD